MNFPYPVLLCDIGGTNVRFALARDTETRPVVLGAWRTADSAGLVEAARHMMRDSPETPRSLIACAAGPLQGRTLQLTNAAWRIDGPVVARRLGLAQGLLLNDFEAMAYALPSLVPQDVRLIGQAPFGAAGPRIVLGPGTGLGLAALVDIDGRFAALPSEAGHIDFAPFGAEEEAIWPHLERAHGRITAETVVSGPGLERIYAARLAALGRSPLRLAAAEITRGGLQAEGDERAALRLLWRMAARFSGDMAITFVARGGVTLAGGVLPRIESLLDEAEFRATFEAKAPMQALARTIPTRLVTARYAVLGGMAAIAAAPERFAIDYATRAWV